MGRRGEVDLCAGVQQDDGNLGEAVPTGMAKGGSAVAVNGVEGCEGRSTNG